VIFFFSSLASEDTYKGILFNSILFLCSVVVEVDGFVSTFGSYTTLPLESNTL
jgi:hypothetical protein